MPVLGKVATDAATAADLVRRARAGDAAAFAQLHERFAPSVHAVCLARLPAAEAEEVTQEVFLTAFRKLATLEKADAVGAWLLACARNAATDRLRERAREPARVPLHEDAAVAPAPDEGRELRERVLLHVKTLPDAYRETLVLRLVEGLTGPEIAEVTGLTPGSVRVNLCRGMELLRELLRGEGWS